jgi:hypothetical protein
MSTKVTIEAQPMRNMYAGSKKPRTELVDRLTTRVPYQLRAHMKTVAAWPPFGYRTQTQMYTVCILEFIRLQPWNHGLAWRQSGRADPETPLYHLHLEPLIFAGDDFTGLTPKVAKKAAEGKQITGLDIKENVLSAASDAGVNQATFTLTFLWWVALYKHRINGVMEPLYQAKGSQVRNEEEYQAG